MICAACLFHLGLINMESQGGTFFAEAEAAAGNSKSSNGSAQKASLGSHGVAGRQQRYTQLLNRALQDSGERQVRRPWSLAG